jgi:hypothetical protein
LHVFSRQRVARPYGIRARFATNRSQFLQFAL